MQPTFHGNCALYGDFVAAQERQKGDLTRATRHRLMQERQTTSPMAPPISAAVRHRIGSMLIDLGTRLSGNTTRPADLFRMSGQ